MPKHGAPRWRFVHGCGVEGSMMQAGRGELMVGPSEWVLKLKQPLHFKQKFHKDSNLSTLVKC